MPTGGALFGNNAARSQNKNLVECKAGKMTLKGKMVHPDKRKGLLYVYQSDDSLMHFCWKDRTTGTVEDDLIIFPDDCEFKRVPQCTTGRVYVLKFKSSNRKFFFWVQEPKTDKDEENCRRINEVLNNPPTPGSQRSGGGTPDGGDLHNLLNNMSQQQLMQLFGGVGQIGGLSSLLGTMSRPSTSQSARSGSTLGSVSTTTTGSVATTTAASVVTTAASTATTTTSSAVSTVTTASTPAVESSKPATTATTTPASAAPIQLSDLQNFLSGMNVTQPGGASNRAVDLAAALTSENLQSVLGDPALVQALQQHLPSVTESGGASPPSEQLRSTLQSPQFQQALSMFSAALQSGQLGPIVQQFEVGAEAVDAANQGNMEEFVKALQKATIAGGKEEVAEKQPGGDEKRKKKDDPPTRGKDDDEDEGMSMD